MGAIRQFYAMSLVHVYETGSGSVLSNTISS